MAPGMESLRQRFPSPGILATYLGFSGYWESQGQAPLQVWLAAKPGPVWTQVREKGLGCMPHERLGPSQSLGLAFKIKGQSLLDGKMNVLSNPEDLSSQRLPCDLCLHMVA